MEWNFDFLYKLGIYGLTIGPVLLTEFITTLVTLVACLVTGDSRLFNLSILPI